MATSPTTSLRRVKTASQKSPIHKKVIRPRVKIWLEVDGEHAFCAGMCHILESIEECGSIKEAATMVGLSYRHVWSRLKEVETALGIPVVNAHVGGHGKRRTTLSDAGLCLLKTYKHLQAEITAASDACAKTLKAELARLGT
ncbi:MAG: winged helix-turn-helix domain-containing protein [Planctomycetaceae bacterium]